MTSEWTCGYLGIYFITWAIFLQYFILLPRLLQLCPLGSPPGDPTPLWHALLFCHCFEQFLPSHTCHSLLPTSNSQHLNEIFVECSYGLNDGAAYSAIISTVKFAKTVTPLVVVSLLQRDTHQFFFFFWADVFPFPFLNISLFVFQLWARSLEAFQQHFVYLLHSKGPLRFKERKSQTLKAPVILEPSGRQELCFLSSHFGPHCSICHGWHQTRRWPGSRDSQAKASSSLGRCSDWYPGSTRFTPVSSSSGPFYPQSCFRRGISRESLPFDLLSDLMQLSTGRSAVRCRIK